MTKNRSRKQRTRQRMESTGESFVQASSKMEEAHRERSRNSSAYRETKFRYIALPRGTRLVLPRITPPLGYEPFEVELRITGDPDAIPLVAEILALQDPEHAELQRPQSARSHSDFYQKTIVAQAGAWADVTVRYTPISVEESSPEVVAEEDSQKVTTHYIGLAPGSRFRIPGNQLPEGYEPFEIQLHVKGDPTKIPLLIELLSLQNPNQPIYRNPLPARSDDDLFQYHKVIRGENSAMIVVRSALRQSYPSEALVKRVLDGKVSLDELLKHWPDNQPSQADPDDHSPRGELLQIVEKWILGKGGRETWEDSYSHDIGWHMLEEWLNRPQGDQPQS